MTALPKIPRPATLLALAVLAVIAVGCGKGADNTLIDPRDGQKYRTVKIGGLTWMAKNLNYQTDNSVCYENKDGNCRKYGRLYNWNDAMKACPAGWRLPSDEDWDSLAVAAGGWREEGEQRVEIEDDDYHWKFAGKKLKSTTGWGYCNECNEDLGLSGNGTDEYGFSALPGGFFGLCCFFSVGDGGNWWSATEYGADHAWHRDMGYNSGYIFRLNEYKTFLFSVRCVEDIAK